MEHDSKLHEDVGYIKATVAGIAENLRSHMEHEERLHTQYDDRLRTLEDQEVRRDARAGILGTIAGFCVSTVVSLVEHFTRR